MTAILPLNAKVMQKRRLLHMIFLAKSKELIVVANILVLLLYFWKSEMGDIILQSIFKKQENLVNTRNVSSHVNKTVEKKLLLIKKTL